MTLPFPDARSRTSRSRASASAALREQVDEAVEPGPLGAELEQLLLEHRARSRPGRRAETRAVSSPRAGSSTSLGLRDRDQLPERLERPLGLVLGRLVVLVVLERLDLGCPVRPPLGQLDHAKTARGPRRGRSSARRRTCARARARRCASRPAGARRRPRGSGRTRSRRRGTRRSAPGSGPRRCGAGRARSGAGRARAGTGRSRARPKTKPGYSPRVAASVAEIADSFFRPAVQGLVPYEPGKPVEEVQRELGLARCVKLASNEGPFGPFPAALGGARALRRRPEPLSRTAAPGGCAARSPSGSASPSRRSPSAPARTG